VGAVALAVVVSTGGAAPAGSGAAAPAPAEATSVSSDPAPGSAPIAPRSGSVVPEPPRVAVLPSGAAISVVPVSTTADGTLDVPADVDVSGWWRGGSRLGDPFGAVLLSAHVDSRREGLGPYVELLTVEEGDRVELASQHLRQEYVVTTLRLIGKDRLDEHPWVYAASGPHRLVMVTCAGPYDPDRGGYQRLAVVTATAVGAPTVRND